MSAPIALDAVTKSFDRREGGVRAVLENFSLRIEPGEMVALVGPSGCGKTTILNLIAGLERPDDGTVTIGTDATGGTDGATATGSTNGAPPTLGMVFQSPRLLDWLPARENVAIAARAAGISDDAVDRVLDAVGLADHARAFPTTLSGGQRQRLAVARAFVVDPDVILLDEPFSALDELTARRLRLLLQELWLGSTRTGVLVSHNPLEAALLADRVVVLAPSPARIVGEYRVALGRPRQPEDERLYELHREIIGALV